MRTAIRTSLSVLTIALVATVALWPTEPVHAMAGPQGAYVLFGKSAATIIWTEVPGSRGYAVTIRPRGVEGPFGQEQVLGDRWTVPYAAFPHQRRGHSGYTFEVCAISENNQQSCEAITNMFYEVTLR